MKVYRVDPAIYYHGFALVGAKNAELANQFINTFKEFDKDNRSDSRGYCNVSESDALDYIYTDTEGILLYGIFYGG